MVSIYSSSKAPGVVFKNCFGPYAKLFALFTQLLRSFLGWKTFAYGTKISIRHKTVHEIDLTSNHFPVSTKFIKLFKLSQNYYQNEWYSSEKSFRAPEKYHLPLFFLNYKTFIWDIEWFLCRELKHNFHKQSSRVCVCGGCVCVCVRVCGVLGHGMGVCVCVC